MLDTVRSGYHWEEVLVSWVALHGLIQQHAARAGMLVGSLHDPALYGESSSAASESSNGLAKSGVPALHSFLLQLFGMEEDPVAQLDYIAEFKPAQVPVEDWNRHVTEVSIRGRIRYHWNAAKRPCVAVCCCVDG